MFNLKNLFGAPDLDEFDASLSRERLIQAGRIIIIDDEEPLLISELKSASFSVDHDRTGDDLHKIDQQIYDLAIVDYHGVGKRFGTGQGLELVRHIKRVSPRTRLLAYTSRSLNSTESDFFRLCHAVLPKDLGLVDSLARIEAELRKAFTKEHLFEALIAKLEVTDPAKKESARAALAKALSKGDETGFKKHLRTLAGKTGEKAVDLIFARLFASE
jgi:DNA-binding NarL/FixJ family response regulator